jgi:thiol-disulfide isomerase/thioredoxin
MTESIGPTRWRSLLNLAIATGVVAAMVPGCTEQETYLGPRSAINPDATDFKWTGSDDVKAQVVDRAQFDEVLAGLRGQVILVDFWADWCEPCITNLPHVIELAGRLKERGLAVVLVNVNAPEAAERTVAFLKSHEAGVATNLISHYDGAAKSMTAFEIPSGLPCYRVYDRQGTLRHTFTVDPAAERQFTLQDLDAAIEQLLAE